MRIEKIDRVVEIVEDDSIRTGERASHDRLLQLAEKFVLTPLEVAEAQRRLLEHDLLEEAPHADEAADAESADAEVELVADSDESFSSLDSVGVFLRDLAGIELLGKAEEVAHMRRIRAGQAADEAVRAGVVDTGGLLSKAVADGAQARVEFVRANLRLVVHVVKQVAVSKRGALRFEDLIQEGNLGLLRAIERFDHTRDLKFSTYATWWIWSFVQRAIADRGTLVRLPVHLHDRLQRLRRVRDQLERERDGREPTVHELAEHLGWTPEAVQFLSDVRTLTQSQDRPSDDREDTITERIVAPREQEPEAQVAAAQTRAQVRAAVGTLDKRQRLVLEQRFGLSGSPERTLREIGNDLGVSRERIRQLESAALEQLRHPTRSLEPTDPRTAHTPSPTDVRNAPNKRLPVRRKA